MYATNFFERKLLDTMRGITLQAPSALYIGLYLNNPDEAGGGVEITYNGYERQRITFSAPAEESGSLGIRNDTQINFPRSDTDVGTATYIGISDSKTGGSMYLYGKLVEELEVFSKENPVILQGEALFYLIGDLARNWKEKTLNALRGRNISGFTPYLALFNGDPDDGGSELLGANYSRVSAAFSAPAEAASGQMVMTNSAQINFPRPTTSWGLWTHTAVYDAESAGEPMWIQEHLPHQELKRGYMPNIGADEFKVAVN